MNGGPGQPLDGMRILVTRPVHQAENLCRLVEEAGGEALRMPALGIGPPADPEALRAVCRRLEEYDLAVFVSANAVRGVLEALDGRLPAGMQCAAIGPATAKALTAAGSPDPLCPASGFDSESLLALPQLQHVEDSDIVIFRGDSGRGLLARVLRDRGARVEYAQAYRRETPPPPAPGVADALRADRVDAVVVTSSQALEQLVSLCSERMRRGLTAAQLVVVSERMIQLAESYGFRTPIVAAEPGDSAILESLVAWRTGQTPQES